MHVFTNLIIRAVEEDPECTLDDFILALTDTSEALEAAAKVLNRPLSIEDIFNPNTVCLYDNLRLVLKEFSRSDHKCYAT